MTEPRRDAPPWERALAIDPEDVRRAAGSPRAWRLLGAGWDCDAWLADETVVWRVPRRPVAIPGLERETAVMPIIAARLSETVPIPERVEVPGLPILARHARVPGRELAEASKAGPGLGRALGRFLRELHDPALVRAAGALLPVDPMGRGDPARRIAAAHPYFDRIAHHIDVAPLRRIVDAGAGPALPSDVVCHGDLHIRHVLVDDAGELTGVIDWGDMCVGSRAVDLAIATALPPESRRELFETYGEIDDATWRHARLVGAFLGMALVAADPDGPSGRAAHRWLERIVSDSDD